MTAPARVLRPQYISPRSPCTQHTHNCFHRRLSFIRAATANMIAVSGKSILVALVVLAALCSLAAAQFGYGGFGRGFGGYGGYGRGFGGYGGYGRGFGGYGGYGRGFGGYGGYGRGFYG
ncbi:uncharacterized protein LOC144175784 [Haemaphysalis longicornis]